MSELDEAWALALVEAEARARAAGRKDISEYLALRSENDLIRKIASKWLLTLFEAVAAEANRAGASIQIVAKTGIASKRPASMVGKSLQLGSRVRTLLVK